MKKIILLFFVALISPVFLNAQTQHFTFSANTGDSYSIVLNSVALHGNSLQNGDEIAVFTPAGLCVGAVVWTGTAPLGLTAWADDPQTQFTDGYAAGEAMSFKIWASGTNNEYTTAANFTKGNGGFSDGAYCVVSLSVLKQTGNAIIVINTNDSGEGSLRRALEQANTTIETDTIIFNIPQSDVNYDTLSGVWTIYPQSCLPAITDSNLVIDGTSQRIFIGRDTNPVGPEIEISGDDVSGENISGLLISAPGVEIFELIINNFAGPGIMVSSIETGRISGCYIGVSYDGLAPISNGGVGIYLNWTRKFHISSLDTMPNIISGNKSHGIYMTGATNNLILGNIIGINRTKTDTLGNGFDGIYMIDCDSNEVVNNVIGGNRSSDGVKILRGSQNTISHNSIGCNRETPETNLGNTECGIVVGLSSENFISENIIAYNKVYGVEIYGEQSIHDTMTRNLIFRNGWAGINNGNGGNNDLAAPVLTHATSNSVTGTAAPNSAVEIFADERSQGAIFLGAVTADTLGNFNWAGEGLPADFFFTATATDAEGNTSEFSNALKWATDVEETHSVNTPDHFVLFQNYPNPFNPETVIMYHLPKSSFVEIAVFNLNGQRITTLLSKKQNTGSFEVKWNGRNSVGNSVAGGSYFYRIVAGNYTAVKKLILLK